MMVKRNMELEVEAMKALQKVDFSHARAAVAAPQPTMAAPPAATSTTAAAAAPTSAPTPSAPPSATGTTAELLPRDRSDADAQLELALRLSAELAKTSSTPSETTVATKTAATSAEFEKAVRASVVDHDIYESEFKREQAEIEHAIALSLALEVLPFLAVVQ
jgi:hypothetical protein